MYLGLTQKILAAVCIFVMHMVILGLIINNSGPQNTADLNETEAIIPLSAAGYRFYLLGVKGTGVNYLKNDKTQMNAEPSETADIKNRQTAALQNAANKPEAADREKETGSTGQKTAADRESSLHDSSTGEAGKKRNEPEKVKTAAAKKPDIEKKEEFSDLSGKKISAARQTDLKKNEAVKQTALKNISGAEVSGSHDSSGNAGVSDNGLKNAGDAAAAAGSGGSNIIDAGRTKIIYKPRFEYPMKARRFGYEGTVILHLMVDTDGTVNDIKVHSPSKYPILDEYAVRYAKRIKFSPYLIADHPSRIIVRLPVTFKLR